MSCRLSPWNAAGTRLARKVVLCMAIRRSRTHNRCLRRLPGTLLERSWNASGGHSETSCLQLGSCASSPVRVSDAYSGLRLQVGVTFLAPTRCAGGEGDVEWWPQDWSGTIWLLARSGQALRVGDTSRTA